MWLAISCMFKKMFRRGNPIGLVLVILGTIIVGLCIPPWFWLALFGVGIFALGWWLHQKC